MIYLFLQSVVPTVPAGWLTFADGVVYKHYDIPVRVFGLSATHDQQMAGAIMKIGGGDLPVDDRHRPVLQALLGPTATRTTAIAAPAGCLTAEIIGHDVDALTYDEVTGVFESSDPAPSRCARCPRTLKSPAHSQRKARAATTGAATRPGASTSHARAGDRRPPVSAPGGPRPAPRGQSRATGRDASGSSSSENIMPPRAAAPGRARSPRPGSPRPAAGRPGPGRSRRRRTVPSTHGDSAAAPSWRRGPSRGRSATGTSSSELHQFDGDDPAVLAATSRGRPSGVAPSRLSTP